MTSHSAFTRGMQELSQATDNTTRVSVLSNIGRVLESEDRGWITNDLRLAVQSSNLVQTLVTVLMDNRQWVKGLPSWFHGILNVYKPFGWDIPIEQTHALVEVLIVLLDANIQELDTVLSNIFHPRHNKLFFLNDRRLYDTMRVAVFSDAVQLLAELTYDSTEWQLKIIQDHHLVLRLCQRKEDENVWVVLFNLAQHPDAKVLLPLEVVETARYCKHDICKDICAILSNEGSLQLTKEYLDSKKDNIQKLLNSKSKMQSGSNVEYNLLELVLPLVNLSVMEAHKEKIGIHMIGILLEVMELKQSPDLIKYISQFLQRSQRETTKILWNLAFLESNRKSIEEKGGIEVLERVHKATDDDILKRDISGILFMFSKPEVTKPEASKPEANKVATRPEQKGHIMISYNWACQPTVFRLANELKERGFKIWLDTEQMKGSTLEAMASAIEGASLILMCVSQKYKDSPNCRFEGEYVVSRKVNFIPLKVQRDYRADGWLGLIMGSKLYHNFSDEDNWEVKLNGLLQEISAVLPSTALSAPSRALTQASVKTVQSWTTEDVVAWLKKAHLGQYADQFAKNNATGEVLLELKALLARPESILPFANLMGITEPFAVLKLTSALRKL